MAFGSNSTFTISAVLTATDNMSKTFESVDGKAKKLGISLKSSLLGGVVFGAASKAVGALSSSLSGAVSRYDTLKNFPKVMSNFGISASASSKAMDKLSKGIDGLPTTLDSAVSGVQRFTASNSDINKSTKYFLAMNDAIVAGGQSSQIQASAVEQLSQSYNKGKMDMMEWRSIQSAMPAQLNQIAKAMGMSVTELGEGLRGGTISMDDFMDTIVELDTKGVDGFQSFAQQARNSTSGIQTQLSIIGTALKSGIANCMDALDTGLAKADLPTIGDMLGKVGVGIKTVFKGISGAIGSIPWKRIKKELAPSFEKLGESLKGLQNANWGGIKKGLEPLLASFLTLSKVAVAAITKIVDILKVAGNHSQGLTYIADGILGVIVAFKAAKGINGIAGKFFGLFSKKKNSMGDNWDFKDGLTNLGKSFDDVSKSASNMFNSFSKSAKMVGVASLVASFALLAKSMSELGSLGASAIAPMMTFGVVIAGLAVVFSSVGKNLQTSAVGIGVFAAAISGMALTMTMLVSTGTQGTQTMITFGLVIAGLAAVFAALGGVLTAGAVGIGVFGATVAVIGIAISAVILSLSEFAKALATLQTAVSRVIASLGNAISMIITAWSKGINVICDGVSKVIGMISGGFSSVLDSIANIIEKFGVSADLAGGGMQKLANGIGAIVALPLADMVTSLGAVVIKIGALSHYGESLSSVGSGMMGVAVAVASLNTNIGGFAAVMATLNATLAKLSGASTRVSTSFATLASASAKLIPISTYARTAASGLSQLSRSASSASASTKRAANGISTLKSASASTSSAVKILNATTISLGNSGSASMAKFANAIKTKGNSAVASAKSTSTRIKGAFRGLGGQMYSIGANIGQGVVNGLKSKKAAAYNAGYEVGKAGANGTKAGAKTHSPSKITTQVGKYIGDGLVIGMQARTKEVYNAAKDLVTIPSSLPMDVSGTYDGAMADAYAYNTIEVPLYINSREFARATSDDMQTEIAYKTKMSNRRRGQI